MGQILSALLAIKSIIEAVGKLAVFVIDEIKRRKKEREKAKAQKASENYKKANEVVNDEERMQAKMDALCELDPNCAPDKRND